MVILLVILEEYLTLHQCPMAGKFFIGVCFGNSPTPLLLNMWLLHNQCAPITFFFSLNSRVKLKHFEKFQDTAEALAGKVKDWLFWFFRYWWFVILIKRLFASVAWVNPIQCCQWCILFGTEFKWSNSNSSLPLRQHWVSFFHYRAGFFPTCDERWEVVKLISLWKPTA